MSPRPIFSSRAATLLTMIGVAVGLGNVWRFPYMMGRYGGSAFLLIYLLFVVAFAIPALSAEWVLGRATRRGPVGAFSLALGRVGRAIALVLVAGLTIASSYYVVVVGNVIFTAVHASFFGFERSSRVAATSGLEDGTIQAAVAASVVALALLVIFFGLRRGIERVSLLFVPFFGLVVTYLIVASLALPGALAGLRQFMRPDFSSLSGTAVFAAMGQAFFSLSLGGTFFVTYGSYLRRREPVVPTAIATASGDVGAAILAALFIVPSCLAFGIDLESGPRLVFYTLPRLFDEVAGGRVLGPLFFYALATVAFLSVVAGLQVVVSTVKESFGVRPVAALVGTGVVVVLLMLPSAADADLIARLDLIFGSGFQVAGSGLAVVAVTWGLSRSRAMRHLFGEKERSFAASYFGWLRWAVPLSLAFVLMLYIRDAI